MLQSLIISLLYFSMANAQTGRYEQELSGDGWSLWLDHGALWADDEVHLPPVDVQELPVHPPSGGWGELHQNRSSLKVSVPGTVEEHYWGAIGGAVQDTAGDYVGVSWWSRKFRLGEALKGKRITLAFQSVNLRAEVFVNGKLVGYDVVGNTPFDVDATEAVKFGQENELDIRITDPVGNFSWNDNILMRWGENLVPAVHGFGGITGKVVLRATDPVAVSDIYVQNQRDPRKVKIFASLENYSGSGQKGRLEMSIHEKGDPKAVLWERSISAEVPASGRTFEMSANVPKAELWELSEYKDAKEAKLYVASIRFVGGDNAIVDSASQRFGFRWFDVGEKDNDKRFYLNGKRIFIKGAMTWGYWPKNGIFPTKEMADREMKTMSSLGLNTMMLHRAIGHPGVFDYADAHGFFTYEEPGGYRVAPNPKEDIDGPDTQALEWRREKLRRMVIRDRSIPSLIVYNLKNGAIDFPDEDDNRNMKMIRELDPSRILTYTSGQNKFDYHLIRKNDPFELYFRPFIQLQIYGWWDQHHAYPYPGYTDNVYRNPKFYLKGVMDSRGMPIPTDSLHRLDKRKVVFFGEDGHFGTMLSLQKIKEEIEPEGATGFREQEHLDWFDYYNKFLDRTGFRKAYANVDSLTMSLGRNMHYFHGRSIENVRMSNFVDGYVINGWAGTTTRSNLADMYRNSTADPKILHYYTRPLYIAVKLRNKVVQVGTAPIADLYIINEKGLKGRYTLKVSLKDDKGEVLFGGSYKVKVKGGEDFGQLLVEGVKLPKIGGSGYYNLEAELENGGTVRANGYDEIYAVDLKDRVPRTSSCAVLEDGGTIKDFLEGIGGVKVTGYGPGGPETDAIIVGDYDFERLDDAQLRDMINRVAKGTKLIVLENADKFAHHIDLFLRQEPKIYKGEGIKKLGIHGRYFVGNSPVLAGLPQAQGMSWEYQCFYMGPKMGEFPQIFGLKLETLGTELIVALGDEGSKEILSALSRVPVGRGSVTLSTLNILPNLREGGESAVVAKKLFLNLLDY